MQLFNETWLALAAGVTQIIGTFLIFWYVVKTVEIAKANRESAKAAQAAAHATLESVQLSERTIAEMKAARDATTAPYVVVSFELQDNFVLFVMENIGQTVAREVSLKFEPAFDTRLRPSAADPWPEFITGTTRSLAPRQRLTAYVNHVMTLSRSRDNVHQFTVTVSYYGGATERERREIYVLDIGAFSGSLLSRPSDVSNVADNIKELMGAGTAVVEKLNSICERLELLSVGHTVDALARTDVLATTHCLSLVEALEAQWQLVRDQHQDTPDRIRLSKREVSAIQRTLDQIIAVAPFLSFSPEIKIAALRLVHRLYEVASQQLAFPSQHADEPVALMSQLKDLLMSNDDAGTQQG